MATKVERDQPKVKECSVPIPPDAPPEQVSRRTRVCIGIPILLLLVLSWDLILIGQLIPSVDIKFALDGSYVNVTSAFPSVINQGEISIPSVNVTVPGFALYLSSTKCFSSRLGSDLYGDGSSRLTLAGLGFTCNSSWNLSAGGSVYSGKVSMVISDSSLPSSVLLTPTASESCSPHMNVTQMAFSPTSSSDELVVDLMNDWADVIKELIAQQLGSLFCLQPEIPGPTTRNPDRIAGAQTRWTLWDSIRELYKTDEDGLATLLLILSGIWPHVNHACLLLLWIIGWVLSSSTSTKGPRLWFFAVRALEWLGKWSIGDAFFVGLLTVLLKFTVNSVVTMRVYVVPLGGVYVYYAGVILSLVVTSLMRHMIPTLGGRSAAERFSTALVQSPSSTPEAACTPRSSGQPELRRDRLRWVGFQNPLNPKVALALLLLLGEVTMLLLGLFYSCYSLVYSTTISGTTPVVSTKRTYSLTQSAMEMPGGLALVVFSFAVVAPLLVVFAQVLAVLLKFNAPAGEMLAQVRIWLQPWDMRDVYAVSLAVVGIRLPIYISSISLRMLHPDLTMFTFPAWFCFLFSIILDWALHWLTVLLHDI